MPSGNESDSDDSVIIVPYVKPKPPEIVLDSDDEDQPPKDAVLTRKAAVQEEVIVQVDSVPVQSVPVVIQETSKTVVAGPSGVQAATPSSSKSKRTTNKTNTANTDNGENSNAVDGDSRKGKKKSLKKTNGKSPAENEAVANSSKSSDDHADNSGKKKRKSRTENVSVVDGSVEGDPSAKVPPKRRKKDSETIHPSQAAAVDHFRFMQQLNLFPENAPEPKVKKSRKKGTSPSSVISPAEIEALNAQISFDIQNNPIRIRPFEAIADDSSLASFDSSTPANAPIEPTQEVAAADVSIGFVSVTEETTGKPRKKRPKEPIQNVVPVPKDKPSPPSAKVVTVPEVEELQNQSRLSKTDKRKVKTKAKAMLMKAAKQKEKRRKERQKQRRGQNETERPSSNDVVWTTSEEEEDNITTAELQAVQSNIMLNVGDGRSRLTVDQMREHAIRKSKPDPTKPRIFDPSLASHGTKRSASPSGLPPAKARTVGTPRARTRQVVQVPTEIDIPWDVSKEGQLEDRSFPNTWSRRMMEFYGGITKDSIDLEGVWRIQDTSPHLWKTREELERSGMRSNKKRHMKCINCKMFGDHLTKDCPRSKVKRSCFMCGDPERAHYTEQFYQSNHTASAVSTKCPKASCLNCGQKLPGKFMQRCQKCAPLFKSQNQKCQTCKLQGHKVNTCPDNWRRFHSITNEAQLLDPVITKSATEVKYKKQKNSFCPNCGRKGHSYFECESRRLVNQWYSPAHPMIHGEPGLEALDGTPHPAAHVMPLRTSRQTLSTSTQRMAPKAPIPAESSAVTKKKSKCELVPDCKNVDSEFCFVISLFREDHKKLVKMNDELMFIEKINSSYNSQEVVVSLLRKRAQIHLGGTHYFRLRKRMSEFINKLKREPGATIHDLLPEFYPPPSSPARASDSSPEVIEIVDSLEEQVTAVPLVTIDDDDDDIVSLPPVNKTGGVVKSNQAQDTETSSSSTTKSKSQTPGVVYLPEKPGEQVGFFSGGFVNIEGEKRDAIPSKKSKMPSNVRTEKRVTRSSKEIQCTADSNKRSAVVTNNTEPTSSKQDSYESSSTPQSSNVVSNNLGAELYLLNKKASNIVGRISAQIRATRRSVEESVQPSSTTSPREDDSSEAINRSNAPESVERYPESVSSSTDVPKPSASAVRQSTSFTRKDGSAKELVCVSSGRSQSISDPDEVLYDRRRRSPRQASQQSQTDQEFESIRYGEGNPINFRDIDERPAFQTGNIWTNAIQDSQNRHQIPPSVFSSPHPMQGGTSQVPMNVSPPLMQNWPIEGNNYGPYPYDQNQYINPFFQQPHPQQMMGGWQNMQPNDNHPFVQDSYANMVVQQQHDFYVPPPQQFHLMGPGPNQIRPNSSRNYRPSEDRQHFRNQEFRRGRGRGGYVSRPRGANRWVRPTR